MAVGLFVFSVPALAVTDDEIQSRCWTEDQCNKYGGIWGSCPDNPTGTTICTYQLGNQEPDQWSEDNCRDIGDNPTARCFASPPNVPLQVGIPGVTTGVCSERNKDGEFVAGCTVGEKCGSAGICRPGIEGGFPGYIAKFYKFFVAALAVVAVVMVMWGGFKRIMAAGSPERIKDANSTITGAITGVVIALLSYSLLNLVNPQLVANTLPLIEKVKPDFFGFCPVYHGNEVVYENGWYYLSGECFEGVRQGQICNSDADCPGSSPNKGCIKKFENELKYNPPGDSCGAQLKVANRVCTGLECSGNQGCFVIPGTDPPRRDCANFYMQGDLSGNKEADQMALELICNDGTSYDCFISGPLDDGGYSSTYDSEGRSGYAFSQCMRRNGNEWIVADGNLLCGGYGGYKGIMLKAEIDCGGFLGLTCDDDWYAIDASTCGTTQAKPIKTGDETDPDNIDWTQVTNNRLLGTGSTATPPRCNLNLSEEEFPNRTTLWNL